MDIIGAFRASLVSFPTGTDIPIYEFLSAKYLLSSTITQDYSITDNLIEVDIGQNYVPSSMPTRTMLHSDEQSILGTLYPK